jgi:hypothetical protein
MITSIEQNKQLLEAVELLYFTLEDLFYELAETKNFELTPYVVKRLYDILTKYNNVKTELEKTYQIEHISRTTKCDPLISMFHLIIDALTMVQLFYQEILNGKIDMETLFVLDNIMSRIQRTILFFHYFNFAI